jgi:murein DD-endopeptidase MepM/ murein hydrolase activator NlpD
MMNLDFRSLWVQVVAAALSAAALTACRAADAETNGSALPIAPLRAADIAIRPDSEILDAAVPARTTLAALLDFHNVLENESVALIERIGAHFDLRRFRAGQRYRLDRYFDGRIREFEYEIDGDRRVVAHRVDAPERFAAVLGGIPKTRSVISLERRITNESPSLIEALDADDGLALALSLADVFSGEVDFNNDLQPGDVFRVVVERSVRDDGKFGGYGPVLAAELANEGRALRAVRFALPDGKPDYYDDQGRSLKRFFLKTPLKFDPRITSGFSRARLHPVLNYARAHNGVDYAAPPGAPVAAVAGGVVTFAGWTPGGGRTVKIRHASGYESEYLHLSSIAAGVRTGARVAQGELVGRVGATGLVTGPHLHYGLKRNGAYVNPVREHRNMPPGEPVPAIHLAAFGAERDRLLGLLTRDPAVRTVN